MKSSLCILIIMLLFPLALSGCGGSQGAPGSTGTDNTGIIIASVAMTTDSPDIDTAIHFCDEEQTTPEEPLTRTDATMTITAARLLDTGLDPFPASVESCTITYLKANEDPASPIIESLTIYPNCILASGATDCPVTLMDIERKTRYWDDITQNGLFFDSTNFPSEYPTHYIANFNCTYMNRFGQTGTFQVEHDIWLADFERC